MYCSPTLKVRGFYDLCIWLICVIHFLLAFKDSKEVIDTWLSLDTSHFVGTVKSFLFSVVLLLAAGSRLIIVANLLRCKTHTTSGYHFLCLFRADRCAKCCHFWCGKDYAQVFSHNTVCFYVCMCFVQWGRCLTVASAQIWSTRMDWQLYIRYTNTNSHIHSCQSHQWSNNNMIPYCPPTWRHH